MNAPFPPPPGQAVAWAFPTQSSASGYIHTAGGAQSGYGEVGIDTSGRQYGFSQMWASCGLCNWTSWAFYYNFVSTLPTNVGTIHGIYMVVDSQAYMADVYYAASYEMWGANFIMSPGATTIGGVSMPVPASSGTMLNQANFGTFATSSSLGTNASAAALSTYSMVGRFFQTLSLSAPNPPTPTFYFQSPRLAIYYDAPVMPIGHGCNANNYSPITLFGSVTTAPGNGIITTEN